MNIHTYAQPAQQTTVLVTATENPIPTARWVGDDWQFEVAYQNTDGTAFDLTSFTAGAALFNHSDDPIELASGTGETFINGDPTEGLIYAVFYKQGTTVEAGIIPDENAKKAGETRLQVYIVDTNNLKTTILVQPIWVRQE